MNGKLMKEFKHCKKCKSISSRHETVHVDSLNACIDLKILDYVLYINREFAETVFSCENTSYWDVERVTIYSDGFKNLLEYFDENNISYNEYSFKGDLIPNSQILQNVEFTGVDKSKDVNFLFGKFYDEETVHMDFYKPLDKIFQI